MQEIKFSLHPHEDNDQKTTTHKQHKYPVFSLSVCSLVAVILELGGSIAMIAYVYSYIPEFDLSFGKT